MVHERKPTLRAVCFSGLVARPSGPLPSMVRWQRLPREFVLFQFTRSILDGYKLILTSLLISMGISTFTSNEFVIFCRVSGWLALAMFKILGRIFLQNARNRDEKWSPHSLPQMFQWLVMGPPRGKSVAVMQEGEEVDRQVAWEEVF